MRRIPTPSSIVAISLLALFSVGAFRAKAQVVEINTGTPNTPLYAVGPIYVSSTLFYRYSRFAYLYTQAELAAAGIVPGTVILSTGWMKSTANSATGPAVFSIYMKNSNVTAYSLASETWANLSAGAVQVYTNPAQSIPDASTPNYIDFTLTSPFTYTGGSLEILTEWDISAAPAPIATGAFEWVNTTVADRIYASGNTSLPATLSSTTNNVDMNDRRPVLQLTVEAPTSVVDELAAGISLWPNPTDRFVTISNSSGTPIERVEVINALGRAVMTERPNNAATSHQLDLEQLAAGHYLIGLYAGTGRALKRVKLK